MNRFVSLLCFITLSCGLDSSPAGDSSSEAAEAASTALRGTPRVDSVSPLTATIGVSTTFTVTGKNLGGLQFRLSDCDDIRATGGTSSARTFECTPGHSPGQKPGALVIPSTGALAFSFFAVYQTSCTQPQLTGSFTPSGNELSNLDALFQAQNPVVAIVANGSSLTFTSRNGETGTISLTGATANGTVTAGEAQGLNAFRVVDATTLGVSSQGPYQHLTFGQVALSSPFEGFQFLDPFFNGTSWATSVVASGNTLHFSDVFGANGTITFNCAQ